MSKLNFPKWIFKFLSESEIKSISEVVQNAETTTSGEIVPVIVRRSSSIGHLPGLITCLILILFFLLNGFNFIDYQFKLHFSNSMAEVGAYLSLLIISVLFYLFSMKLAGYKCVQRALISDKDKNEQVNKRVLLEFYLNHITKTEYKTGIIIFISLMERQTVVLGDEAISKKIPAETWQEIVDFIVNSIKQEKTADGIKTAIQKCGNILSLHFPKHDKNPNELENHLVIKE